MPFTPASEGRQRRLARVSTTPLGVKVAAAAVLITAWVPAVIGAWEIIQVLRTVEDPQAIHFGTPAFFVITAILLTFVVPPLLKGQGWARSVTITWLLVFAFAATTLFRSLGPLGWGGIAVAVIGLGGLAMPSAWSYFGPREFLAEE